ncbi:MULTISPECIES: SOS response-associated peptidase [unclassified Paenibacillus]|uniref:SOS response-associated peptidase n=1 Tax=unclassified Paenibacillus TaxID=185978 RepID=UPI001C0FD123|nr:MULTISPECIES: SOS response-associated peptidase [unclassified Paenibacillus]MBU5445362.1 SOS response-associated peptidase [Paenibacillus sp. MSJ-34]CAH0122488.1 SOS response-associated protein YedK [Paenibacillus sp. CECT 9249]
MCGRYTITVTMEELLLRFFIEGNTLIDYQPRYNVAPGQFVPAIVHDGKNNRLGGLKWGLIPEWSKEEKLKFPTFNARAETIADKAAFRTPFRRKRCIIPADSFYEWKATDTGKQPMRIMLKNKAIFALAGLYDTWTREDGTKISTCTVVTTTPNRLMSDIHDRMPVILRPEDEKIWLNRAIQDPADLQPLLVPYPEEEMTAYPVSPLVGSVKNDSEECVRVWNPGP